MFPLSMRKAGENQLMFNLTFSVRISRFPQPPQSDLSSFKYIVRHALAYHLSYCLSTCRLQQRFNRTSLLTLVLRMRKIGVSDFRYPVSYFFYFSSTSPTKSMNNNKKGKGHPCTGTEALYRPYGP